MKIYLLRLQTMTLKTVVLSIQSLLAASAPSDPKDTVVGMAYRRNYSEFREKAQHWTNQFAKGIIKATKLF